jgi:hypothetical protein
MRSDFCAELHTFQDIYLLHLLNIELRIPTKPIFNQIRLINMFVSIVLVSGHLFAYLATFTQFLSICLLKNLKAFL